MPRVGSSKIKTRGRGGYDGESSGAPPLVGSLWAGVRGVSGAFGCGEVTREMVWRSRADPSLPVIARSSGGHSALLIAPSAVLHFAGTTSNHTRSPIAS